MPKLLNIMENKNNFSKFHKTLATLHSLHHRHEIVKQVGLYTWHTACNVSLSRQNIYNQEMQHF